MPPPLKDVFWSLLGLWDVWMYIILHSEGQSLPLEGDV